MIILYDCLVKEYQLKEICTNGKSCEHIVIIIFTEISI